MSRNNDELRVCMHNLLRQVDRGEIDMEIARTKASHVSHNLEGADLWWTVRIGDHVVPVRMGKFRFGFLSRDGRWKWFPRRPARTRPLPGSAP